MKNKINPNDTKEIINTFNYQKKIIAELNKTNKNLVQECYNLRNELNETREIAHEREYTLEKQNLYLFLTCFILIIVTAIVLIKS